MGRLGRLGMVVVLLAVALAACGIEKYDKASLWVSNETAREAILIERRLGLYWVVAPGDVRVAVVDTVGFKLTVEIWTDACVRIDTVDLEVTRGTVLVIDADGVAAVRGSYDAAKSIETLAPIPPIPCS